MPSLYADVNTLNSILDTYTQPSSEGECYSRIDDLTNLREEALSKGFDKGFFPTSINMEGLSAEDKRDIAKQMKDLKYAWYLKKATLRRISFALASYKIALFHFKHGLFTDLIKYMPYDGRFLVRAIKSKAPIASAYFDILNLLKGEVVQMGISVDILIPSEEGDRMERVQLYGVNNVSEYVRSKYGREAKIISTRIITKHDSLLTSKYYARVLALAAALSSSADFEWDDEGIEIVREYNKLLRKHGLLPFSRIDSVELPEKILDDFVNKGFATYTDEGVILSTELALNLNYITTKNVWKITKKARTYLGRELLKLAVIVKSHERRNLGVFTFGDDYSNLIRFLREAGLTVDNMDKMLRIKEDMEMEGLFDSKIGMALYAYLVDRKGFYNIFGKKINYISKEMSMVEAFLKGGRGSDFLRHLRGHNDNP